MTHLEVGTVIEGKEVTEVLHHFDMLYSGWELDEKGWVVKCKDGVTRLVTTDHGLPRFSDYQELYIKIDEYNRAIKRTSEAISIMTNASVA